VLACACLTDSLWAGSCRSSQRSSVSHNSGGHGSSPYQQLDVLITKCTHQCSSCSRQAGLREHTMAAAVGDAPCW
jgi:hypothetical protein